MIRPRENDSLFEFHNEPNKRQSQHRQHQKVANSYPTHQDFKSDPLAGSKKASTKPRIGTNSVNASMSSSNSSFENDGYSLGFKVLILVSLALAVTVGYFAVPFLSEGWSKNVRYCPSRLT